MALHLYVVNDADTLLYVWTRTKPRDSNDDINFASTMATLSRMSDHIIPNT